MKSKPNKQEIKLQKILDTLTKSKKFIFTGNFSFWIDGKNPDFLDEKNKKVIEFFGDYWHSKDITGLEKIEEEENRKKHFLKNGYQCLIIWESELKDLDVLTVKILNFIKEEDYGLG